jgi:hypothetical protein
LTARLPRFGGCLGSGLRSKLTKAIFPAIDSKPSNSEFVAAMQTDRDNTPFSSPRINRIRAAIRSFSMIILIFYIFPRTLLTRLRENELSVQRLAIEFCAEGSLLSRRRKL